MRKICCFLLVLCLLFGLSSAVFGASDRSIVTTPTGFTQASDVEYVIVDGTVVNWGARGEDATFLTSYAENYYIDSYHWDTLSQLTGGTGTSDASQSDLYEALQDMMQKNHAKLQGYQDTRPYYQYTDCISNDYSKVSSFYSGKLVNGTWNGTTYNREHIWPKSKCINQSKAEDSADIMMLRPTISSENSSRGNKAYGESSGYFDPGTDTRGDCARMVLYGYVRWGNSGKMWGSAGVMESLEILLKWMEEDPVDTWEMGRNDAVESITGVRNVFVDYPEYAWLLFGQEVPDDYQTPSGSTEEKPCAHENTHTDIAVMPTCVTDGYTGDTLCLDCGCFVVVGEVLPATGEHRLDENRCCIHCDYAETEYTECTHEHVEHRGQKEATCASEGHTGDVYCADCGELIAGGSVIPATGEHTLDDLGHCTGCPYTDEHQSNDISISLYILIGLGAVAVAAIVIIIIKKKKEA